MTDRLLKIISDDLSVYFRSDLKNASNAHWLCFSDKSGVDSYFVKIRMGIKPIQNA